MPNPRRSHPPPATIIADLVARNNQLATANAALRERIAALETPNAKVALKVAAYRAGIQPERLRRWCDCGKVEAEKIGGQWFVDEISLAAHMRALTG